MTDSKDPVAPIVLPADMSEEDKAMLSAGAKIEAESAIHLRDTIISESLTTARWVQTSLLLINGGAAAAALGADHVEPWARGCAGAAFVTGIAFALLTGLMGVSLVKEAPRKINEFAGYWISVQFDLLRSEDIERAYQDWVKKFERRAAWIYLPGSIAFAAFMTGAAILGLGAK